MISGYASTYNAKILNSFNPELQLKDIESAIRNKLKDLLNKLKEFRFMATLVLEFKKKKKWRQKQDIDILLILKGWSSY